MNPGQAISGTVLSARYTLTERIAAGGMGEVWAATDTLLDRTVAVKLLHSALTQERGFIDRFRAEARLAASLHHPNITTVFDYGEDDGAAYLVMELVAGQPLSQIIAERSPLSAQETSSILIQAATALEAAHRGGVIHRDVKPANILITDDGTAKLTDFGISRLVDAVPLTQTGQVLGTAQYLSPEQAMGLRGTASSDLYALGVVGHEMLTGQRPFDAGSAVATALAHVNDLPPPLPETVPVRIRTVISAAMAKDPADRPASAAVMAHALGMPDSPIDSVPRTRVTPVPPIPGSTQIMPTPLPATEIMPTPLPATEIMPTPTPATEIRPGLSPASTQVMTTPSPATQVMPTPPMPTEPPRAVDRRSRRHPRLLPATIATALVVGAVTFFALHATSTAGTTAPPTGTSTGARTSTPATSTAITGPTTGTTTAVRPPLTSSASPPPKPAPAGKGPGKRKGKQ